MRSQLLLSFFNIIVLLIVIGDTCQAQNDQTCSINDETCQQQNQERELFEISWGVAQRAAGQDRLKTIEVIEKTEQYMKNEVFKDRKYRNIRKDCQNRNELCSFWAAIGECDANPKYMLLQCAPSCQTCDQIDYDARCPYDYQNANELNAWKPGSLNELFARITTDPYYINKFEPTIHSRDPWIVTLENVVTEEECKALIDLGAKRGYEQSMDVGAKKFDGTFEAFQNDKRTSTNAWCVEECYTDDQTTNVLKRIENITGIPDSNSEYLQLLRYEVGQFYGIHHDYIPHNRKRPQGVRILTVFLYLNDVEAGGGTRFTDLDITVMPKRGRALLWPSVFDNKPDSKDSRTHHEALPVEAGVKYGANAWVHQRDFKKAYTDGCT